jgi:hypothetical protein
MYNLTVDDAHTFFVGEQAWLVHNQCRITLGLAETLENKNLLREFTEQVNGENWHSWGTSDGGLGWKVDFMRVMSDPDNVVFFNLTGVNAWAGAQRGATIFGGPTDWELFQIRIHPQWWDRITWMLDGEIVPNPFE